MNSKPVVDTLCISNAMKILPYHGRKEKVMSHKNIMHYSFRVSGRISWKLRKKLNE